MVSKTSRFIIALAVLAAAFAVVPGFTGQAAPDHVVCPTLEVGCTHTDLQAAIDDASAGHTIAVTAGTYVLSDTIVVDKPLTILGPQAGVDPRPASNSDRDPADPTSEAILVGPELPDEKNRIFSIVAGGVTIDGLVLRDHKYGDAAKITGASGVIIRNTVMQAGGGAVNGGVSVNLDDCDGCTMATNLVEDPHRRAFYVGADSADATITDNEIVGHAYHYAAIELCGPDATVTGNLIRDSVESDGYPAMAGIAVGSGDHRCTGVNGDYLVADNIIRDGVHAGGIDVALHPNSCFDPATTTVTIRDNIIGPNNAGTGVRVGPMTAPTIPGAAHCPEDIASAITITGNDIAGNPDGGVTNGQSTGSDVDARGNYWGSQDGPSGVGPGTGDAVTARVDYGDFFAGPIVAGPFTILGGAHHCPLTVGWYADLQHAADCADPGATIAVDPGTYPLDGTTLPASTSDLTICQANDDQTACATTDLHRARFVLGQTTSGEPGLAIEGDRTLLTGLGFDDGHTAFYGTIFITGDGATLNDLDFHEQQGDDYGALFVHTRGDDTTVSDSTFRGTWLTEDRRIPTGILSHVRVSGSHGLEIAGNVFHDCIDTCITMAGASSGSGPYPDGAEVHHNAFTALNTDLPNQDPTAIGLDIRWADDQLIHHNTYGSPEAPFAKAIVQSGGHRATMHNETFVGAIVGLSLEGEPLRGHGSGPFAWHNGATIRDSDLSATTVGIEAVAHSYYGGPREETPDRDPANWIPITVDARYNSWGTDDCPATNARSNLEDQENVGNDVDFVPFINTNGDLDGCINVGGTWFETLQDAIDAAGPGGVVAMQTGETFTEAVTIPATHAGLTLCQADGLSAACGSDPAATTVNANGTAPYTITVAADDVELEGFTVRNTGLVGNGGGIHITGDRAWIHNVHATGDFADEPGSDSQFGVVLSGGAADFHVGSDDATDSTILSAWDHAGLYIGDSARGGGRIEGTTFTQNGRDGILWADNDATPTVATGNTFSLNGLRGINVEEANAVIDGNTFQLALAPVPEEYGAGTGVLLQGASTADIRNNQFTGHALSAMHVAAFPVDLSVDGNLDGGYDFLRTDTTSYGSMGDVGIHGACTSADSYFFFDRPTGANFYVGKIFLDKNGNGQWDGSYTDAWAVIDGDGTVWDQESGPRNQIGAAAFLNTPSSGDRTTMEVRLDGAFAAAYGYTYDLWSDGATRKTGWGTGSYGDINNAATPFFNAPCSALDRLDRQPVVTAYDNTIDLLSADAFGVTIASNVQGLTVDARLNDWGVSRYRALPARVLDAGTDNTVQQLPFYVAGTGIVEPPLPAATPASHSGDPATCNAHIDADYANGACRFLTVQAAIDFSHEDGAVLLQPSADSLDPTPWFETIHIDANSEGDYLHGLTLCSSLDGVACHAPADDVDRIDVRSRTIIDGSGQGDVVTVAADRLSLEGLTIRHIGQPTTPGVAGINAATDTSSLTLRDNVVMMEGGGCSLSDLTGLQGSCYDPYDVAAVRLDRVPSTHTDALIAGNILTTDVFGDYDASLAGTDGLRGNLPAGLVTNNTFLGWGSNAATLWGGLRVTDNSFVVNNGGLMFCTSGGNANSADNNTFYASLHAIVLTCSGNGETVLRDNELGLNNQYSIGFSPSAGPDHDVDARFNHWGLYRNDTIHDWRVAGDYPASVDAGCFYAADRVDTVCPPVVAFSYHQSLQPGWPKTLFFEDETTEVDTIVERRLWTFPDGSTSDESSPDKRFLAAGVVPVTLEVWDDAGFNIRYTEDVLLAEDDYRLDLVTEFPTFHRASPGEVISLTAFVRNLGTQDDTYRVQVDNAGGWVWNHPATIAVASGDTGTILLTTTVPSDSSYSAPILVVTSIGGGDQDSATWQMTVPALPSIRFADGPIYEGDDIRGIITLRYADGSPVANHAVNIEARHDLFASMGLRSLAAIDWAESTNEDGEIRFHIEMTDGLDKPLFGLRGQHTLRITTEYFGTPYELDAGFTVRPVSLL